eukprot:m.159543 g.159543  ORF g.159543 m.159543 type:complete len:299 (+) comp23748_c1_seq1:263-1159(+)
MSKKDLAPNSQLLAGMTSGVTTVLLLHPLDLIRVRFQAQNTVGESARGRYTGLVHAFRSVAKREGVGALYQGVSANALGSGAAWGLYFFGYEAIKSMIRTNPSEQLSPQHHMAAALSAGACTLACTNPIWVVKTRMILQVNTAGGTAGNYRSVGHALQTILRTEGMSGLYAGFVPGLFGTLHGAVQFMVYEELKVLRNTMNGRDPRKKLDNTEYIAAAITSKTAATVSTYPFQVLRTRLQNNVDGGRPTSMAAEARRLFHVDPYAFYRGLAANLIRVMPATCITFLVYENMSHFLEPR